MLSSGQEFDEKLLDNMSSRGSSSPVEKIKIFLFLPDPILPDWLKILHLSQPKNVHIEL